MIRGSKIILRTVRENELDNVYQMVCDINEKGPFWHLKIPSYREFKNEFETNGLWGNNEGRMLICTHEGLIIGEILFFQGLDYQSGHEIGYELFKREYEGKGYMTEAINLFCGYMFSCKPINRLQINVMKGNTASRRVAEKVGFVYEGTMRKATWHHSTWHDLELFSILREEASHLLNFYVV